MSRKSLVVSICLVLAVAVFLWFRRGKSDQRQIEKNLHALERIVSLSPDGVRGPLLAKLGGLKGIMADPCELSLDAGGISGAYAPAEMAQLVVRFQAQVRRARLSFHDIKIAFPEPGAAVVACTAQLTGLTRSRERLDEFRELRIDVSKMGGKWKFTRFKTIEALEK